MNKVPEFFTCTYNNINIGYYFTIDNGNDDDVNLWVGYNNRRVNKIEGYNDMNHARYDFHYANQDSGKAEEITSNDIPIDVRRAFFIGAFSG